MNQDSTKDSIFSLSKPTSLPWFFLPVMLGVIAIVVLFKWFD